MCFGRPDSEKNPPDYGSLLAGLSTAGFTALIPRFYRAVGGITTRFRLQAAILSPVLCGGFAAFSWHHLVTNTIVNKKLTCAACASLRGTVVLVLCGCILPSILVASVHFNRKTSLPQPVFAAFMDFCYSPYYGSSKPYVIGLGVMQAVLGYGLSSWVYTEEFIKNRNNSRKL